MTSLPTSTSASTSSGIALPTPPSPASFTQATTQLLQTARVATTPCGDGSIVWHIWGEAGCDPALAPLVLLHGGSGSWTHWLLNIAPLVASKRRVFVPDLPGFGDSAVPPVGGDADALVEPLAAGIRQLLGGVPCDLVGFSFGGLTGGLMAAAYPELIARLVLAGAPGLEVAAIEAVKLRSWAHLPDPADREAAHRHNLAALMFFDPESITPLALELHIANVVRDRLKGRRLARTGILLKALPAMRFPVFAIYGREDVLYQGKLPELETALGQAADFRGLVLIDAAGHWVQFEQAAAFDAALRAALDAPAS
ncbi:MAG: alpha/beta fold hydrolase [Comamonadaceae bacterium]|nr:MAG: alpha/beta fold hydrolase [Comamonadaceae bacterium]